MRVAVVAAADLRPCGAKKSARLRADETRCGIGVAVGAGRIRLPIEMSLPDNQIIASIVEAGRGTALRDSGGFFGNPRTISALGGLEYTLALRETHRVFFGLSLADLAHANAGAPGSSGIEAPRAARRDDVGCCAFLPQESARQSFPDLLRYRNPHLGRVI